MQVCAFSLFGDNLFLGAVACPRLKPSSVPSAQGEISSILRDICGPAPCALGHGWMDTGRALFPETDEFAKWKFWYKWTEGHGPPEGQHAGSRNQG